MKIILVHKYWYWHAGAERYVFDLRNLLEKNGHTVIPFAMQHERNEPTEWSRYFVSELDFDHPTTLRDKIRALCRMWYSREARHKFEQLICDTQPDIVHINNIYHHISPSILDACKKYAVPVVATLHDYTIICPSYKRFSRGRSHDCSSVFGRIREVFHRSVKNSLYGTLACTFETVCHFSRYKSRVDAFIAPSEYARKIFIRAGIPANKIIRIGHPVTVKPALGKKEDFILFAGRLAVEKGCDDLLRALRKVDLPLVIAGDGPERTHLSNLARELGIADRVRFLGAVSSEKIEKLIAIAQLLIIPSVWDELFCYTAYEGFTLGTFVIGTDRGALGDFLSRIGPPCVVPVKDSGKLAERINWALSHHKETEHALAVAQKILRREHTPEEYYRSLITVYRESCQAKSLQNKGKED